MSDKLSLSGRRKRGPKRSWTSHCRGDAHVRDHIMPEANWKDGRKDDTCRFKYGIVCLAKLGTNLHVIFYLLAINTEAARRSDS